MILKIDMSNLSLTPSLLEKYTTLTRDCNDYLKEKDNVSISKDIGDKAAKYNAFMENMKESNGVMELMTELAQILKDYKKTIKLLENINTQKTQSEGPIQITGNCQVGVIQGDYIVNKVSDILKCDTESSLKKKIEDLQITNEKLMDDHNNTVSKLKSDIEFLKITTDKKINQLSRENNLLKSDSDKNINEISNEHREKECLQKQNIENKKIISENNITINELNNEINDLKKKIEVLEEELKTQREPTIGLPGTLESNI